jgi:RHS repeat-associated protein
MLGSIEMLKLLKILLTADNQWVSASLIVIAVAFCGPAHSSCPQSYPPDIGYEPNPDPISGNSGPGLYMYASPQEAFQISYSHWLSTVTQGAHPWSFGPLSIDYASLTAHADGTCQVRVSGDIWRSYSCQYNSAVASGPRQTFPTNVAVDPASLSLVALDSAGNCGDQEANQGPPADYCGVGDPINQGFGNKFQIETAYTGGGDFPLRVTRFYNSGDPDATSASGDHWRNFYERRVLAVIDGTGAASVAYLKRMDGSRFKFLPSGNVWAPVLKTNLQLSALKNGSGAIVGWLVQDEDNNIESYDNNGYLQQITNRKGQWQRLQYNNYQNIASVMDMFGRSLSFNYTLGQGLVPISIVLPDASSVQFNFSGFSSVVVYQDGTSRSYFSDESGLGVYGVHGLITGIVDENNSRIATFKYDKYQRAYSYSGPNGIEAVTVAYNGDGTRTISDALSTKRTYTFDTIKGVLKQTGISQPPGSGCSAAASATTYDANGNIATRTDFDGAITTYSYDAARNLETQRVEASGTSVARTINTQWHSYWRLPVKIAEPKKLMTYVYNGDTVNSVVVTCAPAGATVPSPTGTQPIGVLCQMTEQATTDATGAQGFAATVTGSPRTWNYTYNAFGQMLTSDGPRTDVADTTTYTYYAANDAVVGKRGNVATITDALGHITQITNYDANGRPLTILDPNGVTLAFTYFPRGWLKTSSVAGVVTTYAYDNVGQLTSLTRPDASKTSYSYDAAHRLTSVIDLKGNQVTFTLDALGNVTNTAWINPDSSTAKSQSATFDALGRLQTAIETRNAVNFTTTFGFDPNGNPTTVTDPKTKTTTTAYDALNRPTQITDAIAGLTTLAYDARGQLTQFKAPNNAQTNFTVDGLGNVSTETSADRGNLTATHDAAGNLLTLSDARGVVKSQTWDALNRMLSVSFPVTGENRTYTWDAGTGCTNGIGRLCQVTDNGGSTRFAYDARGNLVSKTRSEGGVTLPSAQYTLDGADRVVTRIASTGKLLTTQRDSDGRILLVSASVASANVNLLSAVTTNAAGNITAQSFGNGVTEVRAFNTDGSASTQTDTPPINTGGSGDTDAPTLPEWAAIILGMVLLGFAMRQQRRNAPLSTIKWRGAGGEGKRFLSALLLGSAALLMLSLVTPVAHADEALTYDANGNVVTRTLPGGTTTYGYDPLDRVTSESGPAKTQNLTYDPNDNRLSDGSGSKTYTPNTDRIVTENGQSISLDAAGNVTQFRGLNIVWNQEAGQIKTVSQGATLLATYFYDYEGHRSRKVTTSAAPQGAGTVIYTYDIYGLLEGEFDGTGHPLRTYVWRDGVPVSIIVHGSPETALYLETDHLGTPIAARDQSGKVVWKWESDAFGSTLPNEDPDGDGIKVTINLRFPGTYYDKESGLFYGGARYYDPLSGRFMSPDPIGLRGGPNPFLYANANPLRYIDPTGLDAIIGHNGVLTYYNNVGTIVGTYPYTTGRPGVTDPSVSGQGPIPLGTYIADPKQISEGGWLRNLLGDWGRFRVPLTPNLGTETFGRGGFFLHGGEVPGSAGCVDVGKRDTDIFGHLKNAPGLVPVVVY